MTLLTRPNIMSIATPRLLHSLLTTVTLLLGLAGCATPHRSYYQRPATIPAPPPVSSKVFFYPERGQSPEQQDRDRYECNNWAVQESGYDPSLPPARPRRVIVRPDPEPGRDTAGGAVTGAVLGAIVADPHHTAEGAAVGALAGAVLGAISDQNRQERADAISQQMENRAQARTTRPNGDVQDFRRAMSACLTGRGYTVR